MPIWKKLHLEIDRIFLMEHLISSKLSTRFVSNRKLEKMSSMDVICMIVVFKIHHFFLSKFAGMTSESLCFGQSAS